MKKRQALRAIRSRCPLNIALELFGDRWSLLVLRDLMLKDRNTFKDMLAAEEGIASNILADRLGRLEAEGIVVSDRDAKDRRRVRYRLTEKGLDLAPVLVEMMVWSSTHHDTAAPPEEVAEMRDRRQRYLRRIRRDHAVTGEPLRGNRPSAKARRPEAGTVRRSPPT
jgi:DNA-binding HxlR family transcriptional regulator